MLEFSQSAFRGGESGFIKGHYPIWFDGLPAKYVEDQDEALIIRNWWAIRSGQGIRETVKHPTQQVQGDAQRLVRYFEKIQENEAERESALIQTMLNNLKHQLGNNIPETIIQAERALQTQELSTAYTWLMQYQEDIDKLKEEVKNPKNNNFQNISHMNHFWENEMSKFIYSLFTAENRDYTDTFDTKTGQMTPKELVQQYINHVLSSGHTELIHGVEQIEESITTNLYGLLENLGINPHTKNIFSKKNYQILAKAAQNEKKAKHLKVKSNATKGKLEDMADYMGYHIARGMGAELLTAAESSRHGETFSTGQLKKYLPFGEKVQIKADTIMWTAAEGTIDLSALTKNLADALSTQDWDTYNKIAEEINQICETNGVEIFQVMYNVKGYQSRKNLQIEGTNTFERRIAQLQILANTGAIPTNMLDKIIFLLYNTSQGCLADKDIDYLKLYLGMACTIWMFDDYIDINAYSIGEKKVGVNNVHIFASGGNYYTLSEILMKTIIQLKEYIETNVINTGLFDIEISPAHFDAVMEYQTVVDKNQQEMNDAREADDEGQIQQLLQERWDAMRNLVASGGYMSIKIRQHRLEEILNTFEAYLRA